MLLGSLTTSVVLLAGDYTVVSPDGSLKLTVNNDSELNWSLQRGDETLIDHSVIDIDIEGHKSLNVSGKGPRISGVKRETIAQHLHPVVPTKSSDIHDLCNQLTLSLPGKLKAQFRVYNNGAAYRLISDNNGSLTVNNETVRFNLPQGTTSYWPMDFFTNFVTPQEVKFKELPLDSIDSVMKGFLPVYTTTPKGTRVVITETDVEDYSNLFLQADSSFTLNGVFPQVIKEKRLKPGTDRTEELIELYPYIAQVNGKRSLPWRIVMVADNDAQLLSNTLPWQLAIPSVLDDNSWIKPGKISWDWYSALNIWGVDFEAGANTPTYKYIIDWAAENGLQYILLDEGWSQSTWDITHYKPECNVEELVAYGKEKGVGIVLWALWNPLYNDIPGILDVYEKWGVKGIKIDFMNRSDQDMVNFYENVAREAARRHLLVDFHGAYKPCGVQRKYPNVMTFEGVLGMEHNKDSRDIDPTHDLILPFTRMMAGPMDYTPGAVFNRTAEDFSINFNHPMSLGTRAHQAALFVIYESPLQMLADSPSNFRLFPEYASYLSRIPTVWDETIGIDAMIGEYLLMARRNGDTWYVGALTDWTPRDMEVTLDFLGDGKYLMTTYADGVNARIEGMDAHLSTREVRRGDVIPFHMAPGGGWSAIIEPIKSH